MQSHTIWLLETNSFPTREKRGKYGIRKRKRCDDSGPVLLQRGLAWGQIALGGIRWNGDQGRRSGSENLPERNEQPVQGGAGRVFVLKRDNRIANAVRKLSELAEGNHNRKENRERHGTRSNEPPFC